MNGLLFMVEYCRIVVHSDRSLGAVFLYRYSGASARVCAFFVCQHEKKDDSR